MTMKRKPATGNEGKKGKPRIIAISSNYFHVGLAAFLIYIYLPAGQSHIASLIGNGDVIPPRFNQLRVSRGPTVSPTDAQETEESSRVLLHMPSFQPKYLRRETEVHSRNPVYSRIDEERDRREDSEEDQGRVEGNVIADGETTETPTYLQYISARALSNIPEFFQHLKENLQALQQEDEYNNNPEGNIGQPDRRGHPSGEEYGEIPSYYQEFLPERSVQVKPRWKPPASGHTHNIRSFIQPPTEEETYLRRANNYNPSWLYTNLGLGKRRR